MDKRYVIKVTKEDPWPYYVSEIHAGYNDKYNYLASFSYKTVSNKSSAMIFQSIYEVKMVWEFISIYNKIHHKPYKIEMEEYADESRSI